MPIWDQYAKYSITELRALTASAAEVLLEQAVEQRIAEPTLLRVSPLSAARQLTSLLGLEGGSSSRLLALLEDEDQSKEIALKILEEIKKNPDLASAIAERYERRASEMGSPEGLMLTASVLILVIRLKAIQIGSVRITFDQLNRAGKDLISNLLK